MKKNGFTLAEVLITLTIIGVVAALTLPSLNMRVQSSKVGPHLRKFINTMSNANEMILNTNQSNSLRNAFPANDNTDQATADYIDALAEQIRGMRWPGAGAGTFVDVGNAVRFNPNTDRQSITEYGANGRGNSSFNGYAAFRFDSGESMGIGLRPTARQMIGNAAGAHRGIFADVLYDIDGFGSGANKLGIDLFVFRIDNNGSVIPAGSSTEAAAGYAFGNGPGGAPLQSNIALWRSGDQCQEGSSVGTGINCAGSVADNNWRVIYQY